MGNWLFTWLGLRGNDAIYAWWSGFFADITILAAGVGIYRKHTCGVHRCWRFSKHPVIDNSGVSHMVCNHHHPDHGKNRRLHAHHLLSSVEKILHSRNPEEL